MTWRTLKLEPGPGGLRVILNRPEARNSLNRDMLEELHRALDEAEARADCRVVAFEGQGEAFCTGMDLVEAAGERFEEDAAARRALSERYMALLRRLATAPLVTMAKVDGRAMAGGVGLVAACDLALATPRAQFSLSEALWGLLPACVTPYLIRRVGFQAAFRMTLATTPVDAAQARAANLVDEVGDDLDALAKRFFLRLGRLQTETVRDLKGFFRKMWLINEDMERAAVDEISRLMATPRVRRNIEGFVNDQKFPWERD